VISHDGCAGFVLLSCINRLNGYIKLVASVSVRFSVVGWLLRVELFVRLNWFVNWIHLLGCLFKLHEFSRVKVKVKLSLCLTKHHAMKAFWGSGGIAALIL
jgi:hypothetical protein